MAVTHSSYRLPYYLKTSLSVALFPGFYCDKWEKGWKCKTEEAQKMQQITGLQREEYPGGRKRYPHSGVAGPWGISDSQMLGAEKFWGEERTSAVVRNGTKERDSKGEFFGSLSLCGTISHTAASGHLWTRLWYFSMLLESDWFFSC